MGAKKRSARTRNVTTSNNVINLNFEKRKEVLIKPRNLSQEDYLVKVLDFKKSIVFGIGPAGCGKTLLAVQSAIKLFKDRIVDKIVITRPACSADEDLGFLPGTLEEKMAPWVRPVIDVFREYYNARDIQGMLEEGILEIAPLAYMRGRTFHNSFIIFDEAQNCTPNQMKMALTRIGDGSKMVVTGDLAQADRSTDNGLLDFMKKLQSKNTNYIDITRFTKSDVERHNAVKEVLNLYGDE